jgi:FtsP/CotA-like multicopper oxidase with cupredoxin domain
LTIDAFAEGDGPLLAPAPLIRVPEGTTIVATVRNDLTTTLQVHGLCEHDGGACATVDVPASSARTVEFRSGRAGTYSWWASSSGLPFEFRFGRDSQLSGAFVVDPPPNANAVPDADRIFVITEWASLTTEQLREVVAADDPFAKAVSFRPTFGTLINGLSWPETERLTYQVGDAVRWRMVNASPEPHPLHLHGFYFDVDSAGDGVRDTTFAEDHRKRVVTQLVPPGGTTSLTWTPERVGKLAVPLPHHGPRLAAPPFHAPRGTSGRSARRR